MNIHDQVCSMEYAKRLKELGVKQDSLFYLFDHTSHHYLFCKEYEQYSKHVNLNIDDGYSAFTVAELGMILGKYSDTGIGEDKWVCRYFEPHSDITHHSIADTEADARAKMLVFLLENGIIKNDRKHNTTA